MPIATLDRTVIRVDRKAKLVYPDRTEKIWHSSFQRSGPASYNLDTVANNLWRHNTQKESIVGAELAYKYLVTNSMLRLCLGLADAVAIQEVVKQKGIEFYQASLGCKSLVFLGTIAYCDDGLGYFPYLVISDDGRELRLRWSCLGNALNSDSPVARFAS